MYAQVAYSLLKWSPESFWLSTPYDFWQGVRGYRRANAPAKKSSKLTKKDITDIHEMLSRIENDNR